MISIHSYLSSDRIAWSADAVDARLHRGVAEQQTGQKGDGRNQSSLLGAPQHVDRADHEGVDHCRENQVRVPHHHTRPPA